MQGLEHHLAVAAVEVAQGDRVGADQGRRGQAGEVRHQQLLGRRADLRRIVHHQRLGVHRLEQIGGGDIGHVEGRVLTHQDDVHVLRQVQLHLVAEGHVVAHGLAQGHRAGAAEQDAVFQRQGAEVIDPERIAPVLGLHGLEPCGVGLDIDPFDGVHLDRDLQHGLSFRLEQLG